MSLLMAVSSSPRRNGNTELLLNSFVEGVKTQGWEAEIYRIHYLNIGMCQACDFCAKEGECILDDDMQYIYSRIKEAQGLVVASPVYFGTVSGQFKIFIDRFQCWWQAKYRLKSPFVSEEEGKKGFFICVSALTNKNYCANAAEVAKVLFHNLNYRYIDSLSFEGFDFKGSIKEHPDALEKAFESGKKFASK